VNVLPRVAWLLRAAGIDRAVGYTLLGRGWSFAAAPVTLACVVAFLTRAEQGYYYTFNDVLGLLAFVELGLGGLIGQFAAHEMARLSHAGDGVLTGDPVAKGRVGELLRASLRWYLIACIVGIAGLIAVGWSFFTAAAARDGGPAVTWQTPWVLTAALTGCNLVLVPVAAFLTGIGLVRQMARVALATAIATNVATWVALAAGGRLFAAAVAAAVPLALTLWLVGYRYRHGLRDALRAAAAAPGSFSWRGEVWPLQWRTGLTWGASYLTFRTFNPILLFFHGPDEAAKMGLALALMTLLTNTTMAWMTTRAPTFGRLIAAREWKALDGLFARTLLQSTLLAAAGGVAVWAGGVYLQATGHRLADRLLPPLPLAFLMVTAVALHLQFSMNLYMRAYKREPLAFWGVVGGVLTVLSNYLLGKPFGALGMIAGYMVMNSTTGLALVTYLFLTNRRAWQAAAGPAPAAGGA
jgi:hypothetical protein